MRSLSEEMMCDFMNSLATFTATSNHLSVSVKPCNGIRPIPPEIPKRKEGAALQQVL